jgi:hypothetical protein
VKLVHVIRYSWVCKHSQCSDHSHLPLDACEVWFLFSHGPSRPVNDLAHDYIGKDGFQVFTKTFLGCKTDFSSFCFV